jgi:predicted N-acetyltransferase YhbS
VEIRNPNKGHYAEIQALLARCFQPVWTLPQLVERVHYDPSYDPNHVWMAREAGKLVAFMVTVQQEHQGWLKLLAVAPDARRRGIARDLLSRAEFRLSGEGVKYFHVEGTPPFEFLPGVSAESPAEQFFKMEGYHRGADNQAAWMQPAFGREQAEEPAIDRAAIAAFARERTGDAWPWVEEQIGFQPPHMVFRPGKGLILAEPGISLGPLWGPSDLTAPALAIASSQPCADPRGLRFWQVPGSMPPPPGVELETYLTFHKQLT